MKIISCLLLLVIGMAACGPSYPKRFRYDSLDFNIVVASKESVNRHCKKYVNHYDDGTLVGENDGKRIRCCTKYSRSGHRPTIFISEEDEDCLYHELCHINGQPASKCHKVHRFKK